MFRSRVAAAPLRQPVSQTMVSASQGVSRVLGGKNERFAMAKDYQAIVAKSKSDSTQKLAKLGVALALNRHGLTDEVLEVATPLAESNDGPLARAAASLRVRSLGAKLEAARSAALVSGASTEDTVSSMSSAFDKEISELAMRGNDYGSKLARAEFLLAAPQGQHGTTEAFTTAFDSINAAVGAASNTGAASNAAVLTQLLRFQSGLNSIAFAPASKNVEALLKADTQVTPQIKETLAAYKAELADATLSDNEAMILATVQASADTEHHHFDFFDNADSYKLWSNSFCTPFANQLNSFANPEQGFATGKSALDSRLNEITKPANQFYTKVETLEAALEKKDGDVLDNVLAACGAAPSNVLAAGEESYYAITNTIDKFTANHPSLGHGSDETQSLLVKLQEQSLEQLAFRATVGKAVALERDNKLDEAVTALDVVVSENRYLHMWKALLARGRCHRALGNLDLAEADFQTLHTLKATEGYDIPQLDENRYKSVF